MSLSQIVLSLRKKVICIGYCINTFFLGLLKCMQNHVTKHSKKMVSIPILTVNKVDLFLLVLYYNFFLHIKIYLYAFWFVSNVKKIETLQPIVINNVLICQKHEQDQDKVTNQIVDENSNYCFVNIFKKLFYAFFNLMQVMQK